MSSNEYVESVRQMMNQQNVFFGIFLTILTVMLGIFTFMQWRLNDKQQEKLKENIKSEIQNEIDKVMQSLKKDIDNNVVSLESHKKALVLELRRNYEHELTQATASEDFLEQFIFLFFKYRIKLNFIDDYDIASNLISVLYVNLIHKSNKRKLYSGDNKQIIVKSLIKCVEEFRVGDEAAYKTECICELKNDWLSNK